MTNAFYANFPEQIQKRVDAGAHCDSQVGPGWIPLILELDKQLEQIDSNYVINQIKEKFGGLRYYVDSLSDEGWKLVDEAEAKSMTICEVCGQPGKRTNIPGGFWIKTLCEVHKVDVNIGL